jgi:glycosidase
MKKTAFLSLLALLGSTGAAHCQPKPPLASRPSPAQYGQPFKGVPESQNATIYQVNMRGFSQAGDFNGVRARLDSIKALGVNVVYLLPIYPIGQERAVDSPFAVRDYTAVNPEFGTLADLRTLVDAAHARGMAVMLDWVGNHTSWDHPWVKAHPDWYVHDANGNIVTPTPEWKDIAQLNFQNPQLRAAMISALRYWVYAANIDGYRFDYADGPTQAFFTEALANLRTIPGHKLLFLAEGDKKKYYFEAGFQLAYDFPFSKLMRQEILGKGRSVKLLDSLNAAAYRGAPPTARMVRYTSNHDINSSEGPPQELFNGERGAMAVFVVAAYLQAVPMIYNGQEVGYAERVPFMGPRRPINWTPKPAVTREYKQLIRLRNGSAALRNGQLATYSTDDVCAFTKTLGAEQLLVMTNLRDRAVTYQLPASLDNITWQNALPGPAAATGGRFTLQPFQYLVLRKQPGAAGHN